MIKIVTVTLIFSMALAQNSQKATATSRSSAAKSDFGPAVISAEARAIQKEAIIVDTHADTPQRFLDEGFDLGSNTSWPEGQVDLGKIRSANLGAEFFSIWVDPVAHQGRYAHRALDLIDSVYEQAAKHPDEMTMAFSSADILRAHREHKLAALMGVEGGHAIENDLRVLRDFYRLGVRYMTLSWSNTNEWADSSGDIDDPQVRHHNGLTPFGKDVVREMNRLGMIVDISHVADKTFWDAIATTKAPVIASHSSARALTNAPRDMTDDMLRAVAKNGGVVDVNFFSAFVDENYRNAYNAAQKEGDAAVAAVDEKYKNADAATRYRMHDLAGKEWAAKIPRPPFHDIVDHIDHVARVAGIDHVGLGSDFDGIPAAPAGMDTVADLSKITQALLDRGYTRAQILKILGGNFMRVFQRVEGVSREMQARSPAATASK